MEDCNQCGEGADAFKEGVCVECCEQNQKELDAHNAQYRGWRNMSDDERDAAIKYASLT